MEAGKIPHVSVRYYTVAEKTVEQCAGHGADHGAYRWSRQLDPRWNQEQVDAYLAGYERTTKREFV